MAGRWTCSVLNLCFCSHKCSQSIGLVRRTVHRPPGLEPPKLAPTVKQIPSRYPPASLVIGLAHSDRALEDPTNSIQVLREDICAVYEDEHHVEPPARLFPRGAASAVADR